MRASVRVAWRVAAAVAFAATAAVAVTLTRGAPTHAALTSAKNSGSPARHAATDTPQCAASRLDVSIVDSGGSAARSHVPHNVLNLANTGFPVDFTNTSTTACTISGYPLVSAYRGDGIRVGNAAALDTSVSARRIVLAPGATAHAAVVDSASTGRCRLVAATGLRVVLPGLSVPRFVRHPITACAAIGRTAPVFLHVWAIQPGTGVRATWDLPDVQPRNRPASHPAPTSLSAHRSGRPIRTRPVS